MKKNNPPKNQSNWLESLPSLDLDGLQPVFDELAGEHQAVGIELGADRRHISQRAADRRVMLDGRKLANCLETIGRLPVDGESFHVVSHKRWALWDLVRATLKLAAPATIARLHVCTLGFSRENLEQLLGLLDSGDIGQVVFVYSVFFKSLEKEICQRLVCELGSRRQQVIACLQHAKLLLLETTDGNAYVAESSANLRSCGSIEQTVFANDAALLQFHAGWIDDLFRKANQ